MSRRRFALSLSLVLGALLLAPWTGHAQQGQGQGQGQGQEPPVLFTADQMEYDETLMTVTARGAVELSQRDRVLRADLVTYNQKTDMVTATGNVVLVEPSGEVAFADYVELTGDMRDGFIDQLRVLLTDNSRLAANSARRIDGTRKEMSQAVYSPCELCAKDPTRPPLWQMKARRVVHDEVSKDIVYRDAVMEIAGVPVAYMPYFSHPDPTVDRRSGVLIPRIGYSDDLGAVFGLFAGIYYWIGKMSGRQYPEWAGKLHFWAMFIGSNLTFFPQHFLGRQGMPRRYIDYPEAFAYWNWISSIGAFIAFASFVFFIGIIAWTLLYGRRVTANNYWNEHADTLEWTVSSPPPEHTFETLPKRQDWDTALGRR